MWIPHAMKKTRKARGKNILGERIRKARATCKPPVSQEDLAGRLASQGVMIDRSAVSRIENEDRYLMDYEIAAIARALKIPIASLFGEGS